MDLAASWRMLTKQKLNIVNGIRLENASWRTWAKQRNNLKTISPDTLNWLKDSDVTWLYGPLHSVIKEIGDTDKYSKTKISTTEDTLGLMISPEQQNDQELSQPRNSAPYGESFKRPNASPLQNGKPLKSALKKVTMSDLLKRSVSELQINTDTDNISISKANQQLGAFSPAVIASHRQPKLRFNQYVEQCIALSVDDDKSKKRNSKIRMAELKDTTDDNIGDEEDKDDDEDATSSDNYGDESDAGSIMIMRRKNKLRSIKKIEPTLLKTNSRSDHDGSVSNHSSSDEDDDDDVMPPIAASGYRHHHKSTASKYVDWDAQSAESDAFVKHIINVSKGKKPIGNRDPAADRIPTESQDWNDGNVTEGTQAKSDYDYEFDDDDWDTNSEHPEDMPFTSNEFPPVAPSPPVGCEIASSSSANPHTVLYHHASRPSENARHDQYYYDEERDQTNSNNNNNTSNNSFFSNIAHWASSHLWPAENK